MIGSRTPDPEHLDSLCCLVSPSPDAVVQPAEWNLSGVGFLRRAIDASLGRISDLASRSLIKRNKRTRRNLGALHCSQGLEIRCLPATLPVLTITDATITEPDSGSSNADVVLTLSKPSTLPVRFSYYTRNRSAAAVSDYTATRGVITIPAGQTTAQFPVKVLGDTTFEPDETFEVVLGSVANATLARSFGTIAVQNNDSVPSLTAADAAVVEGQIARITLSLSNPSSKPIPLNLAGISDTALSGRDFPALNRLITIPSGATQLVVSIPTTHDVIDEPDESLTISLTNPIGVTVADDTISVTIRDNDPPALRISDVVVNETAPANTSMLTSGATGTYQATISMSSAATVPVSVRVMSRNVNAVVDRDYARVLTTVTIPAGEMQAVVNLSITDDILFDPNERFELVLSSPLNATIADGVGTVSIVDNDPEPILTVADTTVTEGNSGETIAVVRVNMSRPSTLPVTFQYRTNNGTALVGQDYFAATGTLVIPAGATSQTFSVRIKSDLIDENPETIRIGLTNVVNGSINATQGQITIEDNDPAPRLSMSNATIVEGDASDVTTAFVLTLSAASERTVTVNYRTENHTATAGVDYHAASGTVTFLPGQTTATIDLKSVADLIDEPSRAFRVMLSNPVAVVLSHSSAVVTVGDDDGTAPPLFQLSDMQYLGGFRVPTGRQGSASFEFGGNGLAFNPANNSLFIGSHVDQGLHVAEISIPAQLATNGVVSSMPTASVLQPFVNLGSLISTNSNGGTTSPVFNYENLNLGGLLVANGGLTGAMFNGYTNAEAANSTHSHFRTSTLNLASLTSTSQVGLLDVRNSSTGLSGRLRGGYMAEVPEQWREYIGANYVTGASAQNRIEHSSAGPALFGFDANNPAGSSGDPLVYYPISNALQWSSQYVAQPLFNGTTKIDGVAFVPGTRSIIFIGSNGLSEIGYGVGSKFGDSARPYSGFHSKNGNYKYQIWAYDIDDFMAVRNGSRASWDIRPTSVVNFDLPTPEPARYIGGTAFDPSTGRLYIAQKLAGADYTPVIHVYQLGRQ